MVMHYITVDKHYNTFTNTANTDNCLHVKLMLI